MPLHKNSTNSANRLYQVRKTMGQVQARPPRSINDVGLKSFMALVPGPFIVNHPVEVVLDLVQVFHVVKAQLPLFQVQTLKRRTRISCCIPDSPYHPTLMFMRKARSLLYRKTL
jgi:hypothetical protein